MTGEIRALIFDFDGLILDTEWPTYEAWRDNYAAHGHDLSIAIYVECVGSDYDRFDTKLHLESLTGEKIDWDHSGGFALGFRSGWHLPRRQDMASQIPGGFALGFRSGWHGAGGRKESR